MFKTWIIANDEAVTQMYIVDSTMQSLLYNVVNIATFTGITKFRSQFAYIIMWYEEC